MMKFTSQTMPVVYVMMMANKKPLSLEVIERHVEHLRLLEAQQALVLCGPMQDYAGGMVILRAHSKEDADLLAKRDPFIAEGYKTYTLYTLELADRNNNYLL